MTRVQVQFLNLFSGRPIFQKIAKNIGWFFLDKVIRLGTSLVMMAWLARYLEPQKYGVFCYAQAVVTILVSISAFGIDSIVTRDLVRSPRTSNEILGSAFLLKFFNISLLGLLAFMWFSLHGQNKNDVKMLILILIFGSIFRSFEVIELWFQSQMKIKFIAGVKIFSFLMSVVVLIGFILARAPLTVLGFAVITEFIVNSIGLWLVYEQTGQGWLRNWKFHWKCCLLFLKSSWPLAFSSVSVLINLQMDRILLRQMRGDAEVGIYSAAAQLTEALYFIPVIISTAIFPPLVESKNINVEKFKSNVQQALLLVTALALGYIVFVSFFARNIIHILYGTNYENAIPIYIIHAWCALMVFHISIRHTAFTAEGLQGFVGIFSFGAMILNLFLNYWLIPYYGAIGAACASVLSWSLSALIFPMISSKTRDSVGMFLKSFLFFNLLKR